MTAHALHTRPRTSDAPTFVIVGLGGLGTPLCAALAHATHGRLVLVDNDEVELSNLQRQILYRTVDIGRAKVDAARDTLIRRGVSPARVDVVRARFDHANAEELVRRADVICEGSDDLATKFLVNDAACAAGVPFVIAAVARERGQVFPVRPGIDACYRCLFETVPASPGAVCADAGVLGATCGSVAAWQARAALALFDLGPEFVLGRFWFLEPNQRRALACTRRTDCTACGSSAGVPTTQGTHPWPR